MDGPNGSDPSPVPLQMMLFSGPDWDLVTTSIGSGIAFADGDPILLQNMN